METIQYSKYLVEKGQALHDWIEQVANLDSLQTAGAARNGASSGAINGVKSLRRNETPRGVSYGKRKTNHSAVK
jgi:hypothetical protein